VVTTGPLVPEQPPVTVRPELTDDDVAWLNEHLDLAGDPSVRYAREPEPPPPWGWVSMVQVRG
jgi:hypothetical protein